MNFSSRIVSITILVSINLACCSNVKTDKRLSGEIRLNQIGYFTGGEKVFVVVNSPATDFEIIDRQEEIVFSGELREQGKWAASGEEVKTGDFSAFTEPGIFAVKIKDSGRSYWFEIGKSIYHEASKASLRSFYFQRASMKMEEKYLHKFKREMGHPDDTCYFHPSTGINEGFKSSPGGWYDAGDYGKYVVNAAVSVGTLLSLYELTPEVFPDSSLNIPESGNRVNDLLDEVKYELDWLITMQDTDGGVFHKLTSLDHDAYVMPGKSTLTRYIIGKTTAATLDFTAVMSQSSRIYKNIDPAYSQMCLDASRKAWKWAKSNQKAYFIKNPEGVNTGMYNDSCLEEEFFWAAAELFVTTGEKKYFEEIALSLGNISFRTGESWRNYVDNLGYYALLSKGTLDEKHEELLKGGLIKLADSLKERINEVPYRIPLDKFLWGSNSDILNMAIVFAYAYTKTGNRDYINGMLETTDYIFGKNATGYCFVSGFGTRSAANFHHRLLIADANKEPFPGFLAGGPNYLMQDAGWMKTQGVFYKDTIPAKAYIDSQESYASNEICINWNAPLVFVLAYLDQLYNKDVLDPKNSKL